MPDRKSVRADLERKKILLAQMRKEREARSQKIKEDNPDVGQEDADALLRALGLSTSLSRASTVPSNVSSMDQSRLASVTPESTQSVAGQPQPQQLHQPQQQFSTSLNDSFVTQPVPKSATPLQVIHVNQINIAPKEKVYYTKSTQTQGPSTVVAPQDYSQAEPLENEAVQQKSYYGKQTISLTTNSPLTPTKRSGRPSISSNANSLSQNAQVTSANQLTLEWDDEFPVLTYQDDEDEHSSDFNNIPNGRLSKSTSTDAGANTTGIKSGKDNQASRNHEQMNKTMTELRELKDEERKQVELREDYQQFVERATKILERALYQNESPEIFIQYFPDGGKGTVDSEGKTGNKLSLNRVFFDERWSKNRCVTGFDWSAQYPELLLASYYTNERAPSDPDGSLLVWNMKFKNTSPEYVFNCQPPITSCCFAKFHPSLIIGGTYSGQIVLWDMRSNKKTPVQRSPLTSAAHTQPVYCSQVIGTQNAHNLLSISTDGKLCSWNLDMLSAPQETLELIVQKQTKSVAVTCMSFHPDDYNHFIVGSEDGSVYSACRHGSKTGVLSSFDGHQGLVTSIDYQPIVGQSDYSRHFLTSSIDWTVKLWDSKESEPIHSFESNGDYIYDVRWSPNNPNMFATVDGAGRVDLWNLSNDKELPTASVFIEHFVAGDSRITQPSLNKLIWTPNGSQLVVGDDVGRVHVYHVSQK